MIILRSTAVRRRSAMAEPRGSIWQTLTGLVKNGANHEKRTQSCIITQTPDQIGNLRSSHYDPFWARCEEMDQPVTLHIITGNEVDLFVLHGEDRANIPRSSIECFQKLVLLVNEFIFGGILDRFPKLKVVCSEYEVSWLFYWLFLDQTDTR